MPRARRIRPRRQRIVDAINPDTAEIAVAAWLPSELFRLITLPCRSRISFIVDEKERAVLAVIELWE